MCKFAVYCGQTAVFYTDADTEDQASNSKETFCGIDDCGLDEELREGAHEPLVAFTILKQEEPRCSSFSQSALRHDCHGAWRVLKH